MKGKIPHRLTEHLRTVAKDSWLTCTKAHKTKMDFLEGQNKRLQGLLDESIRIGKAYEEEIKKLKKKDSLNIKDLNIKRVQ